MMLRSFFARCAFVAAFVWSCSSAPAADVTPPPAPVARDAAPVVVGDSGCATCQAGTHTGAKGSCPTCGKLLTGGLFKKSPNPYPVHLCPGACFGYFQTQWRKWDEVCPYPYLGMGASDAGRLPGSAGQRPSGGELPPPRSIDPKMTDPMTIDPKTIDPKKPGASDLPPIPGVPPSGGK